MFEDLKNSLEENNILIEKLEIRVEELPNANIFWWKSAQKGFNNDEKIKQLNKDITILHKC